MKPVQIIGMGMGPLDLTPRHREVIAQAEVLVAGRRLLDHFPQSSAEKIVVTRNIAGLVDMIRRRMVRRRVVVLASGDPLFFGIGATLVRELGPERVQIYPNITSVAAAFARIKVPWSAVRIISCHGRDARAEIRRGLGQGHTLALLTDPGHTPDRIAAQLLEEGFSQAKLCILERLGTADEQIRWMAPHQAAGSAFADPNLVVVEPPAGAQPGEEPPSSLHLGMADEAFCHERGMITKSEVRAVSLGKLRLRAGLTLWDLGAGSGSVGIEASLLLGAGRIAAVEKEPQRAAQIEANAARFGVTTLRVYAGRMPGVLEQLPDPDRVFIGGGGKDLAAILAHCIRRLPPGGILVANVVVLQHLAAVLDCCEALGLGSEVVQLQAQRGRLLPGVGTRLESLSPVWIIKIEKQRNYHQN